MKSYLLISFFIVGSLFHINGYSQCENWNNSPKKAEGEEAHSVYQGALESKDYKIAYEYWKEAYEIAPAADGQRASHYTDGVEIYKHKFKNASTAEAKNEAKNWILKLYDQAAECYQKQAIKVDNCNDQSCYDAEAGYILGRKGYDMYYTLNIQKSKTFQTLRKSLNLAGNQSEYIIFGPLADALAAQFKADEISVEEARKLHQKMLDVLDYNIENSPNYKEQFKQSKGIVKQEMASVESGLYDCEYFKNKLLPEYKANKDDGKVVERVYRKLKNEDCPDSTAIMKELKQKYEEYVDEYNKKMMEELAKTNPAIAAKLAYDKGDFQEAVEKYKEAIDETGEKYKKADFYFKMASIQGRKLNQYSAARSNARKAASLKDNWGRPYMLIGDLYASTSSSCGNSWNQRLAILAAIEKYAYAKKVDPSIAKEANRRIAHYNGSKPLENEAFMRGHKKGDKLSVGCWIDETVSLSF